jgi:predicted nucleotidyltransferase
MTFLSLEHALGSVSKVRILDLLCSQPGRLFTEAEVGREIRMSPNTVNLAIKDLEEEGLVVRSSSASREFRLNPSHPMQEALQRLFQATGAPRAKVRDELEHRLPSRVSVVLFGSSAFHRFRASEPKDIDVVIVGKDKDEAAGASLIVRDVLRTIRPTPVRPILLDAASLRARWDSPLLASIRRDGVHLFGPPLEAHL